MKTNETNGAKVEIKKLTKSEARHLAMIRSADRIDAANAARINAR